MEFIKKCPFEVKQALCINYIDTLETFLVICNDETKVIKVKINTNIMKVKFNSSIR